VRENVVATNPRAVIIEAASPVRADSPAVLTGRRVIAVEDGPTLTHGGMRYGAATIAARSLGATIVDPRRYAVGEIAQTFAHYPNTGALLPAMGYGDQQIKDLEETIARAARDGVEAVAIGTPIDLGRLIRIPVPHTRVRYELEIRGTPTLADALAPVLRHAHT
jgi:predicted GTPase